MVLQYLVFTMTPFLTVLLVLASTHAGNVFGSPTGLTWNEFLHAKNIFPTQHDRSAALATATKSTDFESLNSDNVVQELETLLGQPEVMHQIFENYLNTLFESKDASELRTAARKQIFKNRLVEIARHNFEERAGLVTWTKGVTPFAHLTAQEFGQRFKAAREIATEEQIKNARPFVPVRQAPASIDWSAQGYVTEVKNQNPCEDCFIFSSTAVTESNYAINGGTLKSLSVQQTLDCCPTLDPPAAGCWDTHMKTTGCAAPGYTGGALKYEAGGLAYWDDYPYIAADGQCNSGGVTLQVQAGGYTWLSNQFQNTEADFVNAVGTNGPSVVSVNSTGLQDYTGGVFKGPCDERTDHAVTAVGYTQDYWIVKNSWGTNWGIQGYFQLELGVNRCGVASDMYTMTGKATTYNGSK